MSGAFVDTQSLEDINLYIGGTFYKLTQLAKITRGSVDPPTKMFEVNGKKAIGIGISMRAGGNNLTFGKEIGEVAAKLQQQFPIGIDLVQVSDQPEIVKRGDPRLHQRPVRGGRHRPGRSASSASACAPGWSSRCRFRWCWRSSSSSSTSVDISLQRISLGALVISLGLLVDDAMITVESMVSRIEAGDEKAKAASYAYQSTAFPMLTGTLVTIAGFLPIGLAQSSVGQYTFSLFAVIGVALITSWFVAVIFAPVIGFTVLPNQIKAKKESGPGRCMRAFIHVLTVCMRHRYITVAVTVVLFGLVALRPELHAAPVLPGLGPEGTAGHHAAAGEFLDLRHPDRGRPGGRR